MIETFLPKYPEIHSNDISIFDLFEKETFNKVIFRKKEFYQLRLNEAQPDAPADGQFYNHQKIIARFLASFTPYNELLLFWKPGLGKTCGAIGAIENIIKDRSVYKIKHALIIVKNKGLVKQFQNEVLHTCTFGKYATERGTLFNSSLARPFYHIHTYETFYRRYMLSPDLLKKIYSNSVIVIDEAHDFLHTKNIYEFFHHFLHMVTNRKVILMTGTPMVNDASDIALLMNLILPTDHQMKTGSDFYQYRNHDGNFDEKVLEQFFRGRISYLKSKVNIPFEYQGSHIEGLAYPLVLNVMSDVQARNFKVAFREDTGEQKGSFYQNSLAASLFVYPNGTYGSTGFKTFVQERGKGYVASFLSASRNKTQKEKLDIISQFSTTFASVISNIVENPTQCTFVYMTQITGSGAIIFGLCLEIFGYSRATKTVSAPAKRYAIISGASGTKWEPDIKRSFNRESNKNGAYIQVLIGGDKIKQGVTFWSIQQIHVMPEWNFSSIDQVVARGIRMGAHRHMNANTVVKIYLHCALTENSESADRMLYDMAQRKDYDIKRVEYVIKTSAMDCALTYNRNVEEDEKKDGLRDCEYGNCIYTCSGLNKPYVLDENNLDDSTYQIYYKLHYEQRLIDILQNVFRIQSQITLWELMDFFVPSFTQIQIFQAITNVMNKSHVFINKYGFPSYLHENKNVYFLTSELRESSSNLLSFYNEYPPIRENTSFQAVVEQLDKEWSKNVDISALSFDAQIIKIPSLSIDAQELFIENAIVARARGISNPLVEWVLDYYGKYITQDGDKTIVRFIPTRERIFTENLWTSTKARSRSLRDVDQKIGIYGTYKKGRFSIVDMSDLDGATIAMKEKELSKRGQACSSFKRGRLEEIMNKLRIPIPEKSTNKVLCTVIEEFFKNNSLVIE